MVNNVNNVLNLHTHDGGRGMMTVSQTPDAGSTTQNEAPGSESAHKSQARDWRRPPNRETEKWLPSSTDHRSTLAAGMIIIAQPPRVEAAYNVLGSANTDCVESPSYHDIILSYHPIISPFRAPPRLSQAPSLNYSSNLLVLWPIVWILSNGSQSLLVQ